MPNNLRLHPATFGRGLGVFFCILALSAPAARAAQLARAASQAESAPQAQAALAGLPSVLGSDDVRLYREIFALQADGHWREADARIAKLQDRLLLGHVLEQRYMHPTAYRSRYKELKAWLDRYADHPDARRIYRLAMKRRPAGAARPNKPVKVRLQLRLLPEVAPYRTTMKLSKADRRRARQLKRRVRSNVLRTRLTVTERLLAGKRARKLLDTVELDEAYAEVAAAWFYYGKTEKAYALAARAVARSGPEVPIGYWIAGLAAWQLDDLAAAVRHFEGLAQSPRASSWTKSAGAYWAARAHLRLRQPGQMSDWLAIAARYPLTFYGLLARRALGADIALPTETGALSPSQRERLRAEPPTRRAIALLQAGQQARAEAELKRLDGDGDPVMTAALVTLDERAGVPGIAMRLAKTLLEKPGHWGEDRLATGLFPIPPWRPANGFQVDRALVYAVMRQESGFNPKAKSGDGARGLMQLLPSTANFVVRARRFRGHARDRLYEPEVNIDVGQRYLAHLLTDREVEGDLFRLAIAYNGGPGNLRKWLRQVGRQDDPLMFIERLPSRETRLFIERVLANLWIYRARLGQDLPSLDAIAAGDWPTYTPLDGPVQSAARRAAAQAAESEGLLSHGAN